MTTKKNVDDSKTRRVEWVGHIYGEKTGCHVRLKLFNSTKLISRTLAEQIRDELTEVLAQHQTEGVNRG